MKNLLSGDNNPMIQQIFEKVSGQISTKLDSGAIDEEKIATEATQMLASLDKNPMMMNMLKTMMNHAE